MTIHLAILARAWRVAVPGELTSQRRMAWLTVCFDRRLSIKRTYTSILLFVCATVTIVNSNNCHGRADETTTHFEGSCTSYSLIQAHRTRSHIQVSRFHYLATSPPASTKSMLYRP